MPDHYINTVCKKCGININHVEYDLPRCSRCGWHETDAVSPFSQEIADRHGENVDELLTEFGGDVETIESYLHSIDKDD